MYEIKSAMLLKSVMTGYFRGMKDSSRKIAWCTSVGPAELLRSFGFEIYFPENHGALIGASKKAVDYIPVSASKGFSNQICSYTTSDIGAFLKNETPLTKHYGLESIPVPDLIVYNTNQCREVQDWFNFYAEHFKCTVIGINPPRYLDEVRKEELELVTAQLEKLISACEDVTGIKYDKERFSAVLSLSAQATNLWQEVLLTAKHSPAPFNFFDGTIHMGPIVVLRGTHTAVDYYRELLNELQKNVNNGTGCIENEKCRLFWDGMPIWGRLRAMSSLFSQNDTTVVASTYCNSWVFSDFDEKDPLTSSALAYTKIFINRSEKAKMEMLKNWITEFNIDGMIFHDSKTCFNNSNSRFGLPQRIKNETGIPVIVIEGDLNDTRFFSDGQTTSKMESFIEQIESQKIYS